jgi:hypothetical protein
VVSVSGPSTRKRGVGNWDRSLNRFYLGTSKKTVGSIGHCRTERRQYLVGDEVLLERRLPIGKDYAMGDKGGKKDKDKSKKQKVNKQEKSAKGKQDKTRPK